MHRMISLVSIASIVSLLVACGTNNLSNSVTPTKSIQLQEKLSTPATHPLRPPAPTPDMRVLHVRNLLNNAVLPRATTVTEPSHPIVPSGTAEPSSPHLPIINLVPQISAVPFGQVALTIDDGPSPYTAAIVQLLEQYHVKATFFFVGNRVADYPDAVRAAVAAGDEIGDHTVDHQQLTKLSLRQQKYEIEYAAAQIQALCPQPITLFRPPYESYNAATEQVLRANHMVLALWNRDPRDWAATSSLQVVHNVLVDAPSGGVFDLHDTAQTLGALPAIIESLQKENLQLVLLQAPASATGIPYTATASASAK